VLNERIGFGNGNGEQIHGEEQHLACGVKYCFEIRFAQVAEHIEHIHVEQQMKPVGMQKAAGDEAVPFVVMAGNGVGRKNAFAHHIGVLKRHYGHDGGDNNNGEGDAHGLF